MARNSHVIKQVKEFQALAKIFVYTLVIQMILLMNAYFLSHFGYCAKVWMNRSRILNNRINCTKENLD